MFLDYDVGGSIVTSRNWVKLFLTTLWWGGISTIITSFFVKSDGYAKALQPFDLFEFVGLFLMFLGLGLIFSIISQMGFFAYLTVHQFGLGMFKKLWGPVQVLLIAFTLFDLVYFRYKNAEGDVALWSFFVIPAALLIYGWAVAALKAKETNQKAFIPALFFMVVVTSIEWVPALRVQDQDWIMLMIVPLLVCNTYQLLLLHRITGEKQTESKEEPQNTSPNKKKRNKKKKKKSKR